MEQNAVAAACGRTTVTGTVELTGSEYRKSRDPGAEEATAIAAEAYESKICPTSWYCTGGDSYSAAAGTGSWAVYETDGPGSMTEGVERLPPKRFPRKEPLVRGGVSVSTFLG